MQVRRSTRNETHGHLRNARLYRVRRERRRCPFSLVRKGCADEFSSALRSALSHVSAVGNSVVAVISFLASIERHPSLPIRWSLGLSADNGLLRYSTNLIGELICSREIFVDASHAYFDFGVPNPLLPAASWVHNNLTSLCRAGVRSGCVSPRGRSVLRRVGLARPKILRSGVPKSEHLGSRA